jgi:hypothetical protein
VSPFTLKLELAGHSSIGEASAEAQKLADKLSIKVQFQFNDIGCMALPGGSAAQLEKSWWYVFNCKGNALPWAMSL